MRRRLFLGPGHDATAVERGLRVPTHPRERANASFALLPHVRVCACVHVRIARGARISLLSASASGVPEPPACGRNPGHERGPGMHARDRWACRGHQDTCQAQLAAVRGLGTPDFPRPSCHFDSVWAAHTKKMTAWKPEYCSEYPPEHPAYAASEMSLDGAVRGPTWAG